MARGRRMSTVSAVARAAASCSKTAPAPRVARRERISTGVSNAWRTAGKEAFSTDNVTAATCAPPGMCGNRTASALQRPAALMKWPTRTALARTPAQRVNSLERTTRIYARTFRHVRRAKLRLTDTISAGRTAEPGIGAVRVRMWSTMDSAS